VTFMQLLGEIACLMLMNKMLLTPKGTTLRVDGLPPDNTTRWVIQKKAEVVAAVRSGFLSLDDACKRYKLTIDEFLIWDRMVLRHGIQGLRVTKLRDYRNSR
jgi:hypothetical protein